MMLVPYFVVQNFSAPHCDTNCAIVGGIVAMFTGGSGIPPAWLAAREILGLELQ